MFVIEKMRNDFRERDETWVRARDKWVKSGGDYDYRTKSDYNIPRPGHVIKLIAKIIATAVPILLATGFLIMVMVIVKHDSKQTTKQQTDKNCQAFNKNDHVRVQYGDYADMTGTIIGGCVSSEAYQIKLDAGQKASVPNDGINGQADVGGRTIGVNSSGNLVVIQEIK